MLKEFHLAGHGLGQWLECHTPTSQKLTTHITQTERKFRVTFRPDCSRIFEREQNWCECNDQSHLFNLITCNGFAIPAHCSFSHDNHVQPGPSVSGLRGKRRFRKIHITFLIDMILLHESPAQPSVVMSVALQVCIAYWAIWIYLLYNGILRNILIIFFI